MKQHPKITNTDTAPEPQLEQFLEEFCYDRLENLNTIKKCLKNEDLKSIQAIAHQWKGYCVPYGFNTLGTLAQNLESECEEHNIENIEIVIDHIADYLHEKQEHLKKN